jgi:hypothetical protein
MGQDFASGSSHFAFVVNADAAGALLLDTQIGAPHTVERIVITGPDCPSGPNCTTITREMQPTAASYREDVFWLRAVPSGCTPSTGNDCQTTLAPGVYQAHVDAIGNSSHWFRYPLTMPFVRIGPSPRGMSQGLLGGYGYLAFFAVPMGVTEFAFTTATGAAPPMFIARDVNPPYNAAVDSGAPVPVGSQSSGSWLESVGRNTWVAHVAAGDDGVVWSVDQGAAAGVAGVRLINIPNIFARAPWELMIPRAVSLR